jgi:hypothetical protein
MLFRQRSAGGRMKPIEDSTAAIEKARVAIESLERATNSLPRRREGTQGGLRPQPKSEIRMPKSETDLNVQ